MAAGIAALASLFAVPTAQAALSASASLQTTSGKTRIVVKLTSSRAWTARTRPGSVKVRYKRKTYALSKARAAAAARGSSATFASAAYGGSAGASLVALARKRVSIVVATRAGRVTLGRTLAPPATVNPNPTPAPGPTSNHLFDPPGRDLSGQDAAPFLQRYFLDSRFTDCPAGWPNCSVEERYVHCPDGTFRYRRLTPTSGSDINTVGSYRVTGALVHADGSWIVEVQTTTYEVQHFYHWEVGQDGTVVGSYDNSARLGPFKYLRPAGDC